MGSCIVARCREGPCAVQPAKRVWTQAALDAIGTKEDGFPVRPATVNTDVVAVKSFLAFASALGPLAATPAGPSSSSRMRPAKSHSAS
jgi:hypothetical protein